MLRLHHALILALLAFPAIADETLPPTGTQTSDNNTSCDGTPHPSIDEGADSPGGDWCTADSNNDNWSFMLTFDTPTGELDTGADAQTIELYVQSFDEGQSGDPDIRVDIYDGTNCADLHETGSEISLTDAGYPAKATSTWTAAGVSGSADICVNVVCAKSGGSPGNRNSCNIDALDWEVVTVAPAGRTRRTF